ncbi:hypothetical protein N665_0039s0026 [Sinapis alba]|nr:hypothetical protein N665_0039s0026 [Sinapis alba]
MMKEIPLSQSNNFTMMKVKPPITTLNPISYRSYRPLPRRSLRVLSLSLSVANRNAKSPVDSHAPPLVVVGSANADIYVEIERLPKEGETVSAKTGQTLAGGKGANQAACGAKLLYPTYFVGRLGDDAHGKLIASALGDECGVHLD